MTNESKKLAVVTGDYFPQEQRGQFRRRRNFSMVLNVVDQIIMQRTVFWSFRVRSSRIVGDKSVVTALESLDVQSDLFSIDDDPGRRWIAEYYCF